MNFTFGIITDGSQHGRVQTMVQSILNEKIPNYEIIIVGGYNDPLWQDMGNIIHIPFDENIKRMWITKKKNIITYKAQYENIVYMHDYIVLLPGWYNGFINFGYDFDVCMNPILNLDGTRFRDWVTWWDHDYDNVSHAPSKGMVLPPYTYSKTNKMYISGSYWIGKKLFMIKYPLDENKSWGEGEDVEWSLVLREFWNYKLNMNSVVQLLKQKDKVFPEVDFVP